MRKRIFFTIILIFSVFGTVFSQNHFTILNQKKKTKIPYKLINNLIVLQVNLNGEDLNFLLDTGVRNSLLFNVKSLDSINLKNVKKVRIKGIGNEEYFEALESKKNKIKIKDLFCDDYKILIILNQEFDFSARLGIDIHGIIGADLFENFIVDVNYKRRKLVFNNPETYKYKKCRKCQSFPLNFFFRKPYINASISTGESETKVQLLIDSGSSDALWLIPHSDDRIKVPKRNFDDFLGKGLSGNIFGKKGKLNSLILGKFEFNNFLVSYPDSVSYELNDSSYERHGIIGAELLKRFSIIYDYPNKKISFKKNSNFKDVFFYNKSGLDVIHNGKTLVKEESTQLIVSSDKNSYEMMGNTIATYNFSFENSYVISNVKEKSVADLVGLKENDLLVEINNTPAYKLTLQKISAMLSGKEGKRIKITIRRYGVIKKFKFKLKDLL